MFNKRDYFIYLYGPLCFLAVLELQLGHNIFLHSVSISLVFPSVSYGQLNKAVKLIALDMKRMW